MNRELVVFCIVCLSFLAAPALSNAADHWIPPADPQVVTNNDCGFVSDADGSPVIRRSFHGEGQPGIDARVADRLSSGDELVVPTGSRLEWTSGTNMIVVLGSGSRARLGGLRSFPGPDGRTVTRLDFQLLSGEARVQVRLNDNRPEAVLATLAGAEVLIRRGDVELFADAGWRSVVLTGDAFARVRRGGVAGAPFALLPGRAVGLGGEEMLSDTELAAIRRRLPFSFELMNAALPPLPSMSLELEAP